MFFRLRGRIITRVHLVGWITSVQPKVDRVEYTLDDGSGEVNLVKWDGAHTNVLALGDLVRIQGKLKHSNWSELVEVTISKATTVMDPNEEVLHWMEVRHLFQAVYSIPCEHAPPHIEREERLAQAFLRQVFLGSPSNEIPVPTTDDEFFACAVALYLHRSQHDCRPSQPIRFRFHNLVNSSDELLKVPHGIHRMSAFRRAFNVLRKAGLCHLEDADNDVYCFVTFPVALQPWIVDLLNSEGDSSVSYVVSKVVQLKLFRHLPLDWISAGIDGLCHAHVVVRSGSRISTNKKQSG
ncbi:hypothetical protein H310_08826 [Aphanomyces invadans]|uniref:CST complex subunit STN1 n=1 Tax=Aphanomyces invadans TaxID=157072 RepID=A0A024TXN7_9STRA|nr:hypothetical protein H310_08826 [Aphanomyces invadans]ETV98759.1 hypothetical protein H310_08826 [Aphanomyces invadans]|eukprot:XP_008872956.1 hypothetical protein H310_08826 [Aphanomyces invadans]